MKYLVLGVIAFFFSWAAQLIFHTVAASFLVGYITSCVVDVVWKIVQTINPDWE